MSSLCGFHFEGRSFRTWRKCCQQQLEWCCLSSSSLQGEPHDPATCIRAAAAIAYLTHLHWCSGRSSAVGDMRREQSVKLTMALLTGAVFSLTERPWMQRQLHAYVVTHKAETSDWWPLRHACQGLWITLSSSFWRVFLLALFSVLCHPVSPEKTDSVSLAGLIICLLLRFFCPGWICLLLRLKM